MANRTVKDAQTIHMTNPQYLVEKIIRTRIYESRYWKEECFGLNAELLVDKACELKCIGGVYGGNTKPTAFLCLVLKMLQIQPEIDIVLEFINQEHFKYARALGAFYLRITGDSLQVYKYLEPLFNDNRKLRRVDNMGLCTPIYMDEFIDELFREERACNIMLPRIIKRSLHEDLDELKPRISALDEELEDMVGDDDETGQEIEENKPPKVEREKKKKLKHKREREIEIKKSAHTKELTYDDRHHDHVREREKERERDRDNYRRDYVDRRDREHNRERERERGDRHSYREKNKDHYSRNRDHSRERDRKKDKRDRDSKDSKKSDREKPSDEQSEIDNWNAIRAKLGMAPLK